MSRLIVYMVLLFLCCCLSYCSVLVLSGKSSQNETIIPLIYNTALLNHKTNQDTEQESNTKRIVKYLPPFSEIELFDGELIIENNYQYESSNSRINIAVSGEKTPEKIYINQKIGTVIKFGNYDIKILGLEKIKGVYEPKLLIINNTVKENNVQ